MSEKEVEDKEIKKEPEETKENEKKEKKPKKLTDKEIISSLEEKILILEDKLLRERAEVENFKKRVNDERIKDRKYASQNLVTDLIMALSNLDMAVNYVSEEKEINNFLIGFKMINNQLFETLKNDGLTEIDAVNTQFDPTIHQAMSKEKDETKEDGIVLEQIQKGYKYKDRVIKPAMVKINDLKGDE